MNRATPSRLPSSPAACLVLAMAILGTIGAFATETGLDPVRIVFWRCVFGSLALGVWCLMRGYLSPRSLTARGIALAALGGVCIVLNWVAFFAGIALTTIATTTIVYHVEPFLVVGIGAVFLGERVTPRQIGWMLAAFLGVVLASGIADAPSLPGSRWQLGIALTLLAALLYALATLLARTLGGQRPEVTALCQTLVGTVLLAPFAALSVSVPAAAWFWLIGLGVLHTGVAYALMYAAYPRLGTATIGILTFLYPLVAICVDWAVYGHTLGVWQGLGVGLLLFGTLGFQLGWGLPQWRRSAL